MSLLSKIAGTFSMKLAAAIINLLAVILIARYLGAAGKGETSLLIANITIILLYTGILGGTALIYLTPRYPIYHLILPAYVAALGFSVSIAALFHYWGGESVIYCLHLGILSFLHALFTINAMVLLGKEKVWYYNLLTLLQPLLIMVFLLFNLFILGDRNIAAFIKAVYISYGSICVASFYFIRQLPELQKLPDWRSFATSYTTLKSLVSYGTTAQTANIISFLNNRLSFYFLDYFVAVEAVGVYSVGVSIAEGLWLMGRSIALVQYTRIANSSNLTQSQTETITLARLSFWLTFLALLILLCLPNSFFQSIFGQEFSQVRGVIAALGCGIAAISLGNILIHYFSGTGQYQYNTWAALLGLILTLLFGLLLIPSYNTIGAGLAASLGQVASTVFLVYFFKLQAGINYKDFLPQPKDFKWFKQ